VAIFVPERFRDLEHLVRAHSNPAPGTRPALLESESCSWCRAISAQHVVEQVTKTATKGPVGIGQCKEIARRPSRTSRATGRVDPHSAARRRRTVRRTSPRRTSQIKEKEPAKPFPLKSNWRFFPEVRLAVGRMRAEAPGALRTELRGLGLPVFAPRRAEQIERRRTVGTGDRMVGHRHWTRATHCCHARFYRSARRRRKIGVLRA
jgi:hypothetical protein